MKLYTKPVYMVIGATGAFIMGGITIILVAKYYICRHNRKRITCDIFK